MGQCVARIRNAVEWSVDARSKAALPGHGFCRDETAWCDRDPFVVKSRRTLNGFLRGLLYFLQGRGRVDIVRLDIGQVVFQLGHRLLLLSCRSLSGICLPSCVSGRRLGLLNRLISLPT